MNQRFITAISIFGILMLSQVAFASVSTVSTSMSTSRATTGTSVTATVTVTATATESGSVQLVCSPSGVTISDPSSGSYQGVSLSSTPVSKTFTFTAGTANTYTCQGQSGGVTGDATIVFVDPSALTVTGTPSSKSVSASGETFTLTANIQNSQSNAIATSYSLSLPSGYSASGDSASSTITVSAGTTTALTWTITTGSSSGTVTLSVGDNSNAFSSVVTVPSTTTTTTTTDTTTTSSAPTTKPTTPGVTVATEKGKATITIPSIAAGQSANVNIAKTEDVAISKITIYVQNSVNRILVNVSKLADKPAEVTQEITGNVYHYIKVDKNNTALETAVNKTEIRFKVEKSWLSANSIDESTVAMYRYADNAWNKLETTKIGEISGETDVIYYDAVSPGLSVFAIAGQTAQPAPTTEQPPAAEGGEIPALVGSNFWLITLVAVAAVGGIIFFAVKSGMFDKLSGKTGWNDVKKKYNR